MQNAVEFAYFRAVPGRVVSRYGTKEFIGAVRTDSGWTWSDKIIPILASNVARYRREYKRAVVDGSLVECTKSEYDKEQLKDAAADASALAKGDK